MISGGYAAFFHYLIESDRQWERNSQDMIQALHLTSVPLEDPPSNVLKNKRSDTTNQMT